MLTRGLGMQRTQVTQSSNIVHTVCPGIIDILAQRSQEILHDGSNRPVPVKRQESTLESTYLMKPYEHLCMTRRRPAYTQRITNRVMLIGVNTQWLKSRDRNQIRPNRDPAPDHLGSCHRLEAQEARGFCPGYHTAVSLDAFGQGTSLPSR